jgi:hypothetical protein
VKEVLVDAASCGFEGISRTEEGGGVAVVMVGRNDEWRGCS